MLTQPMKRPGFTIVELLIVIVVIAILAAISIVTYNGIQERAKNSERISAAKQWKQLVTRYTVLHSSYPAAATHTCLGNGYETDWDETADGDCFSSTNVKHRSSYWNDAFETVDGALPSFPTERMTVNSGAFRGGISLRAIDTLNPTTDNVPTYPYLWYYLYGNDRDCGLRPVLTTVSGGVTINPNATNSGNDGPLTSCRIGLPNPTSL